MLGDPDGRGVGPIDGSFVPRVRDGVARRTVGHETVVWSPASTEPALLDPVTSVMLDVIDGEATVDELVTDVEEIVGLSRELAHDRVNRVVATLDQARVLTSSAPDPWLGLRRELFTNPPST